MSSQATQPAPTTPASPAQGASLPVSALGRDLLAVLRQGVDPAQVKHLVQTRTRFDVGLWLRGRRVWLAATEDRLIAFADGPRPYMQHAPLADLATSFYCHMSGELVCVPAGLLEVRSFAMDPDEAWHFLTLIHRASNVAGRRPAASVT